MTKTILIVDDDDDVRRSMSAVLQRHGYQPQEAANAWQALVTLQKPATPVDLIILDLRMPYNVSGSDFIKTLAELERKTPVIVLSGWTADLDHNQLPSFVRAILDKPVPMDTLMTNIETILGASNGHN